mmetsp:Transcript_17363/g.31624  ORF Transcript_17363/g.31624 Transcript_17363/m.31624 type:complete len:219 (+) Transcript_17363:149-805(+)
MRRRAPSEARALPTHALRLVRPDVFDGLLQRDSDRSVSHPQLGLGLRSGEEEVATDGSAHEISRRGGGGAAYAATPPARHNPRAEGQPCRDLEPRARRSRDLGDEVVIFRCDQPLIADQVPLANVIRLPCRSDDGRRGVAHVHIGKNGLARDGGGDFAIDQILKDRGVDEGGSGRFAEVMKASDRAPGVQTRSNATLIRITSRFGSRSFGSRPKQHAR